MTTRSRRIIVGGLSGSLDGGRRVVFTPDAATKWVILFQCSGSLRCWLSSCWSPLSKGPSQWRGKGQR